MAGSSEVRVDDVRSWTLFERITIGLAIVFLVSSIAVGIDLLLIEEAESPIQLAGHLDAIVGLVLSVPLSILFFLFHERGNRKKNEDEICGRKNEDEICGKALQRVLGMKEQHEPRWFSLTPKWVDFESHVCRRKEIDYLKELIKEYPNTLLHAVSGSGKTTLAQHLGYVLLVEEGWRFVIYWDVGNLRFNVDDVVNRIDKVQDYIGKPGFSRCKALFIIDNVHLDEPFARRCAKALENKSKGNMRCLFVARVTATSVQRNKEKWEKIMKIDSSGHIDKRGIPSIEYFPLDRPNFEDAVETITKAYAGKYLTTSEDNPSKILQILKQKSAQSLVLLGFLLDELGENVGDLKEVEKVDVKKAIKGYYEVVAERIVEKRKPLDSCGLETTIKNVLLFVSIYSSMEIPAFKPLLPEILVPKDREFLQRYEGKKAIEHVLNDLSKHGDLIGDNNHLFLPHSTIAEELQKVYSDEFNRLKEAFRAALETAMPTKTEDLQWPDEYAIIAAHATYSKKGENRTASKILARYLQKKDYAISDSLLHYFLDRPADFGMALALATESMTSFSVIQRVLRTQDEDSASPVVVEAIERSLEPWRVIWDIKGWRELREHQRVQSAIADAIEQSQEPWWVIQSISDCLEVDAHHEIQSAIAHVIENSKEPWMIIRAMENCWGLRKHPEIQSAIAHAIKTSEEPRKILAAIEHHKILRQYPVIREVKEDSILGTVDAIKTSEEPWQVIYNMENWRGLSMHLEIQSAIADAIRTSEEPWKVIWTIEDDWPELRNSEIIRNAIRYVRPAICRFLQSVHCYPDMRENLLSFDIIRHLCKEWTEQKEDA